MYSAARTNGSLLEALCPLPALATKERPDNAEGGAAKAKPGAKGRQAASARAKPLRLIDERCDEGYTALQVACARGSVHTVRDALRDGVAGAAATPDVALKDVESGWSALHHALYHGNLGCALVLLEALRGRLKGADSPAAFAPDSLGEALFHGAGSGSSGPSTTALHSTSSPGVAAAVLGPALLLDDALDPLALVRRVRTSRRDASRWGQPLCRAPYATTADAPTLGLPVNDREGLTPLDLLTLRRAPHVAAVRALLDGLRTELRRRPALLAAGAASGAEPAPAGPAAGQGSGSGKKKSSSDSRRRAASASGGGEGDSSSEEADGVHASGIDWDDPANWDLSDFSDIDWGDARLSTFGQRSAHGPGSGSGGGKSGRSRKAGGRGGKQRRGGGGGVDALDEAEFDRQLAEMLGTQQPPDSAEQPQGGGKKGRGRRREGSAAPGGGAGSHDAGSLETGLFTRFAALQAEGEGQAEGSNNGSSSSGPASPAPQQLAAGAAPPAGEDSQPAGPASPSTPRLRASGSGVATSSSTLVVPRSIEFVPLPTATAGSATPAVSSGGALLAASDNRPRWMTTLLSYGRADMQLGYATTGDVVTHPRPIEFPEEVEAAAAALNADAEAGAGAGGGLAEASEGAPPPLPPRALGLEGNTVVSMAAAKSHTMVVTADGALYGWGVNTAAQLGLGGAAPPQAAKGGGAAAGPSPSSSGGAASGTMPGIAVTPVRIPLRVRVVAVAAGKRHTLAVGLDGSLYAWGDNRSGACGWPSPAGSNGASSGSAAAAASAAASTLQRTPRRVEGGLKKLRVLACAAGGHHSLAVTSDGGVWAWGSNLAGQLGVKDVPSITTLMPQAAYTSGSGSSGGGAGDGWSLHSPMTPSSTSSSTSGGGRAAGGSASGSGGGGGAAGGAAATNSNSGSSSDFAAVPPEVLAACIGWTPRRTDLSTPQAAGLTLPSAAGGLSFQALAGLGRADTPAVRVAAVAAGDTFSLALSKAGDVHCAGHGSTAWSRLRFEAAVAAQEDAIAAIQEGAWAVAKASPAEALGPTPGAALSAAAACAEVQALAERGFRVDVPSLSDAGGSGFGGGADGGHEKGASSARGQRERAASASGDHHEGPAIWLRQKGGRGGGPSVPIAALAASKHHAIAVDGEGGVWTWGAGSRPGLLGHTPPVAAAAAVGLPPTALTFPGALSDLMAAGAGRGGSSAGGGGAAPVAGLSSLPPSSPALSASASASGAGAGASGFWFLEPWGAPRRVSSLWRSGYRAARAAASLHGCAIVTRCGDLLAWGEAAGGDRGLLGHGTGRAGQAPVPRKVVGIKGAIDVVAADHHTLVLTALVLPPLPPPMPTETAIAEALQAAVAPSCAGSSTAAPVPRVRVVVPPAEGSPPVSEAAFPGLDPPTVYRSAAEDAAHTGRALCEASRRAAAMAAGRTSDATADGRGATLSPRALLQAEDAGTAVYTGAAGQRARAGTLQHGGEGEPVQALDTLFAEVLTLTTALPAAGGEQGAGGAATAAASDAAPSPAQPTLPAAMNGAGSEGETFRGVFEAVEDVRHRATTGGGSLVSPGSTAGAFRPGLAIGIPPDAPASADAGGAGEDTYAGSAARGSAAAATAAAVPGTPRLVVSGVQQQRFVPSLKSLAQRAVARCIAPAAAPQWLAWAAQHGAATLAAYCGALLHANADALLAAMYLTGRNTGLGARERDRELLVSPEVADGLIWGGWAAPGRADRVRGELVASEASTARLYEHMQAVHTRMLRPAFYSGANAGALPCDAPLSPSMVTVLGHDAALLRRRLFPFDFVDEDGVVRNTGAAPPAAQAPAAPAVALPAPPAPPPAPAPPVISPTGISVVATAAPAPAPAAARPAPTPTAAPVPAPSAAPLALAFDVPAPVTAAFARVLRLVGEAGVAPPPPEPALLRFLTNREGYKNHSYWRTAAAAVALPVSARGGRKGDSTPPSPLEAAVEDVGALFKRAKATRKKVVEAAQLAVTVVTQWYSAKFGSSGSSGGGKKGGGAVKGPGAGLYDADQGAKLSKRGVLIDELWTLTRLLIAVLGLALPAAGSRGPASSGGGAGEAQQASGFQLRTLSDIVAEGEAFLASVAPLLAVGLGPEGSGTHDTSDVLTAKAMLEAIGRGANAEEVALSTVLGAAAVVGPLAAGISGAPVAKAAPPAHVPAPPAVTSAATAARGGGAGAEVPGSLPSSKSGGAKAATASTPAPAGPAKGAAAAAPVTAPAPPASKLGLKDLMSVEAAAAERRKAVEAEAARAKLATLKASAAAEKAAAAAEAALAARVKSAFHSGAPAAPAAAVASAAGRRSLADIQAEQARTGGSGGGGPPAATMATKSSQVWSVYSVRQGASGGAAPPPPAAAAAAAVDFWGSSGSSPAATTSAPPRPAPAKPAAFPALGSQLPKKK